jgi:photosystem II stability/assembly factor-like uncharacterized protein
MIYLLSKKLRFLSTLLLILGLTFTGIPAYSQWTWRNPLPQGNDLGFIHIDSDNSVWAAGDVGTIMHSVDGGLNWEIKNLLGHTKYCIFNDIFYPGGSTGFAVDVYGYIFKTSDAGAIWDSMYWEVDEYLNSSFFTDTTNGYIACSGGKVLSTHDGGETWNPWYFNQDLNLGSIWFTSNQTGYVAGAYTCILKTTDAGVSWNQVHIDTTGNLNSIVFPTPEVGIAVGDFGLVMKTADGGTTWTSQHLGDTIQFHSIGVFSPDTMIVNGIEQGVVSWYSAPVNYRSTDGGETWTRLLLPENYPYTWAITAQTGGTAYATGYTGCLVKTQDYGNTWTTIYDYKVPPTHFGGGIYGIDFPTTQTGYAITGGYEIPDGMILKTTDGGETWEELDTVFQYHTLWTVDFCNENIGCIAGDWLFLTLDGGQNWSYRTSGPGMIRSLCYASTNVCIAVGDNGTLKRSTDCGQSWVVVPDVPALDYQTICFGDEMTGYTAAYGGNILKTSDAGVTWNLIATGYNLEALKFTSADTGIGVGWDGLIIRTTDGGLSWEQIGNSREESLNAVDFYDADTGYAVGGVEVARAIVLKTTDGGITWNEQFIPTNYPLYAIATTGNSAFTGGWDSYLFGTTNGGGTVSSSPPGEKPEITSSIYPNPSANMATICYTLKEPSLVQIRLFDTRGTQVRELANNYESPGNHKLQFRNESLPPGIYYCRIQAGRDCTTKKLVIIR